MTSGALPPFQLAATIAPPHFLSLIATLTVHPTLTTRAKSIERSHAAGLAGRYLRVILEGVGPIESNLAEAFKFRSLGTGSRRNPRGRQRTSKAEGPRKDDEEIVNDLANIGSLWTRGEDQWQVIGWAFNCSILHRRRWDVWRGWLAYMVDVLEADWNMRFAEGWESLEQSLLVRQIRGESMTAGNDRRILRAIFADGKGRAANEFREVWPNETKELRKEDDPKKPVKRIDIEANDYGDYMDEENDADLEDESENSIPRSASPSKAGRKGVKSKASYDADHLGDADSLHLRLRLLALLSAVSAHIPRCFVSTRNLYDLLLEYIRPLPLPTFFLVISPAGLRHFPVSAASSLTQYILLTIISSSAPQPPNDHLNQEVLEQCYLPWAASSIGTVDNAKVSLCVETLLRLLDREGALDGTERLLETAERGIKARQNRLDRKKGKGGRDSSGGRDEDIGWLEGSAERIRTAVRLAMARTERENSTQDTEF